MCMSISKCDVLCKNYIDWTVHEENTLQNKHENRLGQKLEKLMGTVSRGRLKIKYTFPRLLHSCDRAL